MSKVIRISSGTEKVLGELKERMEKYYYENTGMEIQLKEDDLIRNSIISYLEKTNSIL